MKRLFQKYKAVIMYGIFGVITTVINIGLYALCYEYLHIPNVPSNIISWIVTILTAFITNKLWVFESKSMDPKTFFSELMKFTGARVATGVIDLAIMFVGVDVMHGSGMIFKVIANVIVIILNYVLSKLIVFKQPKEETKTEEK
jgi:Predicted membrane protein